MIWVLLWFVLWILSSLLVVRVYRRDGTTCHVGEMYWCCLGCLLVPVALVLLLHRIFK